MKDIFKVFGVIILSVLGLYLIYILFIPMMIGEKYVNRKVTEQSLQYVTSQKRALQQLYTQYTGTNSEEHRVAIKNEMCGIAVNLSQSDIPMEVLSVVRGCTK